MTFVESFQLVKTLPCLAEPGKLIVIGRPSRSIDGLLPLVAAVAPNVIAFNPAAGTLTLRRKPGFITFYPDQVMIIQVKDSAEGLELLDVWTLLPQTNCKQCGEATCMAFAFALLLNKQVPDTCLPLAADPAFAERRAQLIARVAIF